MALDKARETLEVRAGFGGFCNANSVKLIPAEVSRERHLDTVFGFEPETRFDGRLAIKPKK